MGMSSVVILALLGILSVLVGSAVCNDSWCFDEPSFLVVRIDEWKSDPVSEGSLPDRETQADPQLPRESAKAKSADATRVEQDVERVEVENPSGEKNSMRDWYAITKEAASQSVNDRYRQEEIRKIMWRNTGSVMFKDTGEFDFHEAPTIIADREFRVPLGVLGIGITIGGCFFGIPLAGIPVEKRTIGPNVIYCADIYE